MYYSSKEAEIFRILFDTCDDKIRPLLFLQSPLEQIWSVSLKYKLLKKSQHWHRLTVWAMITADGLIGNIWDMMNTERGILRFWKTLSFLAFVTSIETWSSCRTGHRHTTPHYATAVLHFLNDELPGGGLDAEGLSNGLLGHVISPHVPFFFGSGLKCIHNAPQPLNKLNMQSMMCWPTTPQSSWEKPCWSRSTPQVDWTKLIICGDFKLQ